MDTAKKHKKKKIITKTSVNPLSDARRVHAKENNGGDTETETNQNGKKRKLITVVDKHYQSSGKDAADKGNPLSKTDLKARELWHRKSGAGYSFFVQYYASQPIGIVTDDNVVVDVTKESFNKKTNEKDHGRGQSRAAKKRRKKKSLTRNSRDHEQITKETNEKSFTNESQCEGRIQSIKSSGHMISPELQHAMERHANSYHLRTFLAQISQKLPLTFRIRQHYDALDDNDNGDRSNNIKHSGRREEFKQKLLEDFNHLIKPVSYDPSKSIYQAAPETNLVKATLGKISPELKSLILQSTSSGLIARQELGSMLPVIGLTGGNYLKYGSKVLDMCSSPGSKTLQALEIVASCPEGKNTNKTDRRKPGRMVANDIHPLRIESLKDAILRSGLSTTLTDRIIYTNHDASKFPTPKSGKLFDCILADVPCSGDGTIRKDPRILSGWMPSIGNSLHSVQKKILKRALRLVNVGGVVAYSTCSLNPIENEAVVASVLSDANENGNQKNDDRDSVNKVELIEWPDHVLSELKRSEGFSSWRVANYIEENEPEEDGQSIDDVPQLQWYDSFEDANRDRVPHVVESMWPPLDRNINGMNLNRCIRLRPQDNDTGGFFVALLRRVS